MLFLQLLNVFCLSTCELVLDGILNLHNSTTPYTHTSDWCFWQFKDLILADNEFYGNIALIMLWVWDSQWGHFQLSCGWVQLKGKSMELVLSTKSFTIWVEIGLLASCFFHKNCYKSKTWLFSLWEDTKNVLRW